MAPIRGNFLKDLFHFYVDHGDNMSFHHYKEQRNPEAMHVL